MLELKISKNNSSVSKTYGYFYPRASYKQTLSLHDLAVHMAEHHTPFSEGTIEGVLRDAVKCIREQTLMGNTVKIDNLCIFKCTVEGNGLQKLYDPETDTTATAALGTLKKGQKTGPMVKSLKLLAQATGDYTKQELNRDARLGFTDEALAQIAAAKTAPQGGE